MSKSISFKIFITFLIFLAFACGSQDNKNSSNSNININTSKSALIGSWKSTNDSTITFLTFNIDNTFTKTDASARGFYYQKRYVWNCREYF